MYHKNFLMQYTFSMITDQEIQKIGDRVAERFNPVFDRMFEVFATKQDLNELRLDFVALRSTVDTLVTIVDGHTLILEDLRMEYLSMGEQLSRHNRWIYQLADKTHTELSFES